MGFILKFDLVDSDPLFMVDFVCLLLAGVKEKSRGTSFAREVNTVVWAFYLAWPG